MADFGISHIITTSAASTTTGVGGSVRWMAVELLAVEAGKHTKQTDVWAYGMVIYVSACFNTDALLNLHALRYFCNGISGAPDRIPAFLRNK